MVKILTPEQIEALSTKDLVEYYNDLAEASGQEPVRRFADKATGVKRAKKLSATVAGAEKMAEKKPAKPKAASPLPTVESVAPAKPEGKKTAAKKPQQPVTSGEVVKDRRRGTNLKPIGFEPQPCRENSKQAILLDMLRRKQGATMEELLEALSAHGRPWQEITVRAGFGWDLKNKGYGVRSEFSPDGTERFFLVLPEKFPHIPAHHPLRVAAPKKGKRQRTLDL